MREEFTAPLLMNSSPMQLIISCYNAVLMWHYFEPSTFLYETAS